MVAAQPAASRTESAPRQHAEDGDWDEDRGGGEEAAEDQQNLAETLLSELREARNGEEFAATLAEAFHGAGRRGREGELAEKLLAGLEKDRERQQLAGKLLAELDSSQQEELADALLLSGLRRDAQESEIADGSGGFVAGGDAAAVGLAGGEGGEEEEVVVSSAVATALRSVGRRGSAVELLLSKLLDTQIVDDGDATAAAAAAYAYVENGGGEGDGGGGGVVVDDLPGASETQENEKEHGGAAAVAEEEGGVLLYPSSSARVEALLAEENLGRKEKREGERSVVLAESDNGGGDADADADADDQMSSSPWPLSGGLLRDLLFPRKSAAFLFQQYSSEEEAGEGEGEEEEKEGSGSGFEENSRSAPRRWETSRSEVEEEVEMEVDESISAWRIDELSSVAEGRRRRRLGTSSTASVDETEISIVSSPLGLCWLCAGGLVWLVRERGGSACVCHIIRVP